MYPMEQLESSGRRPGRAQPTAMSGKPVEENHQRLAGLVNRQLVTVGQGKNCFTSEPDRIAHIHLLPLPRQHVTAQQSSPDH